MYIVLDMWCTQLCKEIEIYTEKTLIYLGPSSLKRSMDEKKPTFVGDTAEPGGEVKQGISLELLHSHKRTKSFECH